MSSINQHLFSQHAAQLPMHPASSLPSTFTLHSCTGYVPSMYSSYVPISIVTLCLFTVLALPAMYEYLLPSTFLFPFQIPVTFPDTAPEIALPELEGKTAKMFRYAQQNYNIHSMQYLVYRSHCYGNQSKTLQFGTA